MIAGAFVSFLSICVVSILVGGPRTPQIADDSAPQATQPAAQDTAVSRTAPTAPEPDTLQAVIDSDLGPSAVPQAGNVAGIEGPVPVPSADGSQAPAQDAPVSANATVSTPERPSTEAQLSISTDPAQPLAPEIETEQSALGDTASPDQPAVPDPSGTDSQMTADNSASEQAQAAADAAAQAEAAAALAAQAAADASAQAALVADEEAAAIAEAAAAAQSAREAEAEVQAAAEAKAQAAAESQAAAEKEAQAAAEAQAAQDARFAELARAAEAARAAAEAQATAEAQADAAQEQAASAASDAAQTQQPEPSQDAIVRPQTAALPVVSPPGALDAAPAAPDTPQQPEPQTADDPLRPAIGRPVNTLTDLANGVRTNRLPTAQAPAPAQGETSDITGAAPNDDLVPLLRYANAFENPEAKPVMSIVLIDSGADLSSGPIGLEALSSFPYPISFAVDATLPDAADRMAAYRADGFEVLAMVNLPEGATAIDAEVSVASALSTVPEAVAIMEGVGTGVQTTREAAEQVSAILSATGHGFVTQNRGLNTPQKLAARAGVPSAVIFRDFDADGQSPTVIRRFLDQAAFRARQEGAVIMMGRVREETISALLVWGLQDRAGQVALAPISAVLKAP